MERGEYAQSFPWTNLTAERPVEVACPVFVEGVVYDSVRPKGGCSLGGWETGCFVSLGKARCMFIGYRVTGNLRGPSTPCSEPVQPSFRPYLHKTRPPRLLAWS
jgi:hypothetical protein